MRYADQPNPDLLARIPLDAKTLLDIGCAGGALGAAYARLNPQARIYGVDTDAVALRLAAARGHTTACADIEATPDPFPDAPPFDCITFGDVLEHLREPFDALRAQAARLADDGTMVLCVPNIDHWSFTARLLQGTWDYEPEGLLDRTHLRWFTLETMRRGLVDLGLQPCDIRPRIFGPERGAAFIEALRPGLEALGIDPHRYADRAQPLQFVWRVQKTFRPRLAVAATMLAPVGGVSDLRVIYPTQALATDPTLLTQILGSPTERPAWPADFPKIMVLHRPILQGAQALADLRALYEAGWIVVTEFDDHPDYFPALSGTEQYGFAGVHAIQTTTEPLAQLFRLRNGEVATFPNAIPELPEPRNFADPGHLTLFFGALNREDDWEPFIPALNAVLAAAGERLGVSVVHDHAFFEALDTPRKTFQPTCDHATYMRLLGEAEIAFLPLLDTAFNRAKSDLKYIEAAACRVCVVASPTVYAASVTDGRTGLIAGTPEAVANALHRLIADPAQARAMAGAARAEIAAGRMQAHQMAARRAWYWSLWERRAELAEAAYDRVPALRPG